MNISQSCQDDTKRRLDVKAHRDDSGNPDLNGIDYVEIDPENQCILNVHLMDKAPADISANNVRIRGGRRIRDIKVVEVDECTPEDPERTACLRVTVDRAGDFSAYTLCLVNLDEDGNPTDQPLAGFDVRYACVDFSFRVNCPRDLDCQVVDTCPPEVLVEPEIDYLAKDYQSFRQLLLDRLALIMPDWQERHVSDIGIALVEILAYVGDYLSYYQDAVATEAYLGTARQRISVRRHVRLVDYHMHEGCNARAWLFVETSGKVPPLDAQNISFITGNIDALESKGIMLSDMDLQGIPSSAYEVFEPLVKDPQQGIQFYEEHNEILFYTWGEQQCCLPRGATSATLRDEWMPVSPEAEAGEVSDAPEPPRKLKLQAGDALFFEEVLGPATGNAADADPTHRQIVRLTRVEVGEDELYEQPIVEITWAKEDALTFPLCLSVRGPAPDCALLEKISVARGNMLLVDHGQTIHEEPGSVPIEKTVPVCEGINEPGDVQIIAGVFRPALQKAPLTFYQHLQADAPFFYSAQSDSSKAVQVTSAAHLLLQDPRQAGPWIKLTATPPSDGSTAHTKDENQDDEEDEDDESETESNGKQSVSTDVVWAVQPDLLNSEADDYHFVVEMDNDGQAHLRFGDGNLGRMPDGGTLFHATYRIGNGLRGNVGAESISHIVFHQTLFSDVTLKPRNPFAAAGGTDPEPLAEVKLFAPHTFSSDLQRAITADDYARLAERNPKVQRATATLRWTGSWYEALVAIDPLGTEEASAELLAEIAAYLEAYRRIGHDLKVVAAQYIPLDIVITICVQPHFLRGHVKAALLDVFSSQIRANGRPGFFHPDNLIFGVGIALSKLVATAQAVTGVRSVTVAKLERFGEGPNHELENEFLPIGPTEIAQLDNDPSFPEHGKLQFIMEGGR